MKVDLAEQSDEELREAPAPRQRVVRPHGAAGCSRSGPPAGKDLAAAHRVLREILATDRDVRHRLRAIWALYATGGLDEKARLALLDDPQPAGPRLGRPLAGGRRPAVGEP